MKRPWDRGRRSPAYVAWSAARSAVAAVPPRSVGPVTSDVLLLDIPPAEQAAARARGACWDDPRQRLCVPAGSPVAVHRFRRWIAPGSMVVDDGPAVAADLVGLQTYCPACGRPAVAVAGVLVPPELTADPEGFVAFDEVAEHLASTCDPVVLAGWGIGPLRWRHSAAVPQGRVTNGCRACDALLDSAVVTAAVAEHRAGGGRCAGLLVGLEVPVPVAVVRWADAAASRQAPGTRP